jgi:hypothetical protein
MSIITFRVTAHVSADPSATFAVLADPRTHLEWMGKQAPRKSFKLLTLDSPDGPVQVGSTFTSTGANGSAMTFHDRSVVTELSAPRVFAFTTASRLVRRHRPAWEARFEHRYEVAPEPGGSRVAYTCDVYPLNYRPYWLHPADPPDDPGHGAPVHRGQHAPAGPPGRAVGAAPDGVNCDARGRHSA